VFSPTPTRPKGKSVMGGACPERSGHAPWRLDLQSFKTVKRRGESDPPEQLRCSAAAQQGCTCEGPVPGPVHQRHPLHYLPQCTQAEPIQGEALRIVRMHSSQLPTVAAQLRATAQRRRAAPGAHAEPVTAPAAALQRGLSCLLASAGPPVLQ